MTTDKTPATLATVKHGGCVQLVTLERARFEAWAKTHHRLGAPGYLEREQLSGDYRLQPTDYAWAAWQASLSAQPSPGGQGDALDLLARFLQEPMHDLDMDHEISLSTARDAITFALAARQPVTVNESDYVDLPDIFEGARQPVGEPVAWMTHHDEPMLFPTAAEAAAYCEDAEQPVPLFRSPAQAVDDRFPNGLSDAIEYANEMEEAASALYEKVFGHEDDGEDCGTVVMRRVLHHLTEQPAQAVDLGQLQRYEPIGSDGMNMERVSDGRWVKLDDVRALIDSKAVSNG